METIEQIKSLTEELNVNIIKFYKGNKSAGTRARKSAQDLKKLLDGLRKEILSERKKEDVFYFFLFYFFKTKSYDSNIIYMI